MCIYGRMKKPEERAKNHSKTFFADCPVRQKKSCINSICHRWERREYFPTNIGTTRATPLVQTNDGIEIWVALGFFFSHYFNTCSGIIRRTTHRQMHASAIGWVVTHQDMELRLWVCQVWWGQVAAELEVTHSSEMHIILQPEKKSFSTTSVVVS